MKRRSLCQLAVDGHTFRLCGVLKKTVIHNLKRAMFIVCQNGSKHRTSMKCGPCSLAHSAESRQGHWNRAVGTRGHQWCSAQNQCSQTLPGFWVVLCCQEEPGTQISRGFAEMCACKAGVTCQGCSCVLPGTAVSGAWVALSPWGTALLSDPCFAQNRCDHGVLSQGDLLFSSAGILVRGR